MSLPWHISVKGVSPNMVGYQRDCHLCTATFCWQGCYHCSDLWGKKASPLHFLGPILNLKGPFVTFLFLSNNCTLDSGKRKRLSSRPCFRSIIKLKSVDCTIEVTSVINLTQVTGMDCTDANWKVETWEKVKIVAHSENSRPPISAPDHWKEQNKILMHWQANLPTRSTLISGRNTKLTTHRQR